MCCFILTQTNVTPNSVSFSKEFKTAKDGFMWFSDTRKEFVDSFKAYENDRGLPYYMIGEKKIAIRMV